MSTVFNCVILSEVNECESSPCGGQPYVLCIDLLGGYVCGCEPGWGDPNCETGMTRTLVVDLSLWQWQWEWQCDNEI